MEQKLQLKLIFLYQYIIKLFLNFYLYIADTAPNNKSPAPSPFPTSYAT